MKKITLSNSFLAEAEAALKEGRNVTLHIGGNSMHPFIVGGRDVVEIAPCPREQELHLWTCLFYRWEGKYMIHRYVGREGEYLLMMGDGNLGRIERIRREDVSGLLLSIRRPDGSLQDCLDSSWLRRGKRWFRLRLLRRWLLPLYRLQEKSIFRLPTLFHTL